GRVGLALGVQPRVRRRAVLGGGPDQLAVGIRHENRTGPGSLRHDQLDDPERPLELHRSPAYDRGVSRTLTIRGTAYPVLLPKLSDPRLHLAAVIVSLQVLGQAAFGFRLSIAQILISLGTCAVLEVAIA